MTDTGIGMSPEDIGRLFEPFTQADMAHTRRHGGTALGLAISQRLARLLGGQIEVRSEPSKGSTFTLTIDAEDMGRATQAEASYAGTSEREKPAKPQSGQRLSGSVLLAEDDRDLQALLARSLRTLGLDVDTVENGRIASEMAFSQKGKGEPYDLILMDIQMPDLDGHQAIRRLRNEG